MKRKEIKKMRLVYLKPELDDLSQGQRISFARQIRIMTKDDLSDKLGITGENKRRTMNRYEKGERNPKEDRTRIIADILKINYNAIKFYDYKNPIDIVYTLMWLEELIPSIKIELPEMKQYKEKDLLIIQKGIHEWNLMKSKRQQREITYKEYIEWKLTYDFEVNQND
jgi:transcriptional regulator with XRE-family HTH domain